MVHLVHFWLKEEYKTPENIANFEQALTQLCKIPLASRSNWGQPANVAERPVLDSTWDYNLVTEFDSVAIHDEYQTDPGHVAFLNENKHTWEKVLVMDSEVRG